MKKIHISHWEIIVFLTSLSIFGAIIVFHIPSDIQAHAVLLKKAVNGTIPFPANPLYCLTIYAIAFFNTGTEHLYIASVLILSLGVTAKFIISQKFAVHYYRNIPRRNIPSDAVIALLCALLLFAFSIPSTILSKGTFYLGQIPPNVWHNSTTIFLMPFALLLFWFSYEQLVKPTTANNLLITLFCVLNVLIKPSFYFVFSLSYPLMLISRFGLRKELWLNLLPVVTGSALLAAEYYLMYVLGFDLSNEKSGIAISLLSAWSHYSPNIAISLIASTFFPLVYLCFYWKDLFQKLVLQYAMLSFLIAIVIASVFIETGPRTFHFNFFLAMRNM